VQTDMPGLKAMVKFSDQDGNHEQSGPQGQMGGIKVQMGQVTPKAMEFFHCQPRPI
jgi:hypothetical protein